MTQLVSENLYNELIAFRHLVHQNPELSGQEFETTKRLTDALEALDIKIIQTNLATGVIAEIGDASKGPTIALRADIDALPIEEKTNLPYASVNKGVMHACGHDFHQTSLLGAAKILKAQESSLNGRIRLIFQHAEEIHTGAAEVIADGHLKDVQAIIGFHNNPAFKAGESGIKPNGIMAAVDQFYVKIKGIGSHAADPHLGRDTIVTLTQIINQLQTIIARNVSPRDAVVLSVTHIEAGNTWNVLPDEGFFEGTVRSFDKTARALVKKRFYEIVEHIAAAYQVEAEITWILGPNVTNNDPKLTEIIYQETSKFAEAFVPPASNAGEDFATFQEQVPGVFAFIGTNGAEDAPGWHHSDFTVDDTALPFAVEYYVNNAKRLLEELKD